MTKIVLLAAQRTGTHALTSVLHQNGIANFDEVFLGNQPPGPVQKAARLRTFLQDRKVGAVALAYQGDQVAKWYLDYLDQLDWESFVIDIKYNQLHRLLPEHHTAGATPLILQLCAARGYTFIHLVRENAFLRFFSERLSAAINEYHVPLGGKMPAFQPITIDERMAISSIRAYRNMSGRVRKWLSGYPSIELTYEALFEGESLRTDAVGRLGELGITITDRRTGYAKPPKDPRALIANYDAVRSALEANGFGNLLKAE